MRFVAVVAARRVRFERRMWVWWIRGGVGRGEGLVPFVDELGAARPLGVPLVVGVLVEGVWCCGWWEWRATVRR